MFLRVEETYKLLWAKLGGQCRCPDQLDKLERSTNFRISGQRKFFNRWVLLIVVIRVGLIEIRGRRGRLGAKRRGGGVLVRRIGWGVGLGRQGTRSRRLGHLCDDLPIPTLFSLLFLSSPVLNMTLNCINYALCFMTTTDTWNEALVKIPWYRYNS